MATVVRIPLSVTPAGSLINIPRVSTLGTPIHSAIGGASQYDLVTLFATNQSSANALFTLEVAGDGAERTQAKFTVPGHAGFITLLDRKYMGSSIVLTGFGGNSSIINVDGYVDRVTL